MFLFAREPSSASALRRARVLREFAGDGVDDVDEKTSTTSDSVLSSDAVLLGRLHRHLPSDAQDQSDARSRNPFLPPLSNVMSRSPAFEASLRRFIRDHVCPALGVERVVRNAGGLVVFCLPAPRLHRQRTVCTPVSPEAEPRVECLVTLDKMNDCPRSWGDRGSARVHGKGARKCQLLGVGSLWASVPSPSAYQRRPTFRVHLAGGPAQGGAAPLVFTPASHYTACTCTIL